MNDIDFEAEEIANNLLAEEMDCAAEEAYDRWRDMWCDNLAESLEKVYAEFVRPHKHGYYTDRQEKFLEDCVGILSDLAHCDLRANDGFVLATARPKIVRDKNEVLNEVEQPIRN